MAIIKKQYEGIKFPFTCNNLNGFFLDLNTTGEEKVASEIAHVILTTKGTRIRMPDFGTRLIDYIYSPDDAEEWEEVQEEVMKAVSKYVRNTKINKIDVLTPENDEGHRIYLDIQYTVVKGTIEETNRLAIKL